MYSRGDLSELGYRGESVTTKGGMLECHSNPKIECN